MVAVPQQMRAKWESWRVRFEFLPLKSRAVRACAVSLVLHLGFAIWGALWIWETRGTERIAVVSSQWTADEAVELVAPIEISSLEPSIEPQDPGGSSESWINPLTAEVNVAVPTVASPISQSNVTKHSAGTVDEAKSSNGRGQGRGRGDGIGDGAGLFLTSQDAKSFVYVLDCSLSMNHPHDSDAKTRFKRMKLELVRSIASLKPNQQFFIVFFNHEAIPMPANGLVPAAGENPRRYLTWMQEVTATGDTDPTHALKIAMHLQPDVIYFLTDGCFSTAANDIVRKIRQSKTTIHTYSFEPTLNAKQREGLELMRQGRMSSAKLKLGEATYRRTREMFIAEEIMRQLATHNGGEYRVIP